MAHFGWSQTSVNLVTSTYHTLLLLLPITYSSSFVVCFPSVQFIFVLCCVVLSGYRAECEANVKQSSFCFPGSLFYGGLCGAQRESQYVEVHVLVSSS